MNLTRSVFQASIILSLVLSHGCALSDVFEKRAIDCSDSKVKSAVSIIRTSAPAVESYCSSYLHYTQATTTVTTIATSTLTTTSTVKRGITTITTTVTKTRGELKRGIARKEQLHARAALAQTVTADSSGQGAGIPADVISAACSCLVTNPTKTSTITKTSTKEVTSIKTTTVQETKTVTVTTKLPQSSKTTKSQSSTTKTQSSKTTRQSTTTGKTTKTSTKTSTTTAPSSPDPTFYIQFRDVDPGRTDQYNGQYLAQAPDTYRGTGQGAVFTTTTSLSSATLLTLELATRRLRTVREGWYAEAEYFLNLTPCYFDTTDFIESNGFQFFDCSIGQGILTCSVPYPSFRNVMQTCPEYVEFYDTAVELGDHEYTDGPVCYAKQMVVVPA